MVNTMETIMTWRKNMYEYKCKMVKVVDGDTVDVDIDLGFGVWMRDQRIRLYGIDTPESRTRNLEEKVRGKLSKKYLTDLLKSSKKLVVKTHKGSETGKFGRILGELFGNGVNLNLKMCSDGYAVQYYGQNKSLVEAEHIKNKKKLIKKGILKA